MNHTRQYLLIILLIALITACNFALEDTIPPIENDDLIGEWIIDYSKHDEYPVNANEDAREKVIFHVDGTFEQIYQKSAGYHKSVTGKWRAEKIDKWHTRVYLDGAIYYLEGLVVAKDPTYRIGAWDDISNQYVTITGGQGRIILYATRLLLKSDSPCDQEYDLVLRHLPVGDLDAPVRVIFYQECPKQ